MDKDRKPILDVLDGIVPERTPVWLMRQAGRYLPEYRELRAKSKNFLNMCLTPELATEVTLQPLRRFDLDAAILFADILLVPMALGQPLEFREGEGPVLEPLQDIRSLDGLLYDQSKVASVFETLRRVKPQLKDQVTLIGFCGAPWTVACYMIDGNSKNGFAQAKDWLRTKPDLLNNLITRLVDASEKYLEAQIEAGAEVIQIFDSWAGLLEGEDFKNFVIEPTRDLVVRLKKKYPHVPIIGFPREAGDGYMSYAELTGVDAMSIDYALDIHAAKRDLQKILPLQGNLDPQILVAGGEPMLAALQKMLTTFGPLHIANLGHGVVPQTPPENVEAMVEFVHRFAA